MLWWIYCIQVEWYNICLDALNNVEKLYQGKDTADIIQSKVLQVCGLLVSRCKLKIQNYANRMRSLFLLIKFLCFYLYFKLLNGKNEDTKFLLERKLKSGDFNGLHAECLTDTWIGKDRFILSLIHPSSLSFTDMQAQSILKHNLYTVSGGRLLI